MTLSALKDEIDRVRDDNVGRGVGDSLIAIAMSGDAALWREAWKLVRELRVGYGDVFNISPERTLAQQVVELVAATDAVSTLDDLADTLRAHAASEGPWIVSTPLAGLALSHDLPLIEISDDALLWAAHPSQREWDRLSAHQRTAYEVGSLTVTRVFGDTLSRPSRFLGFDRVDDVDTGRTAALVTLERGGREFALATAAARARYALAAWTLLAPPEPLRVTPDIAIWGPLPHIQIRQDHRRVGGSVRIGAIDIYNAMDVPDSATLGAPFAAMAQSRRRSAQALLSASLAAHAAMRASRNTLTERLRGVYAAIEMLCESKPGAHDASARWEAVLRRYKIEQEMAVRGYGAGDSTLISRRLRLARNVATHGADAVQIDLGWPQGVPRGAGRSMLDADDLGLAALHADLEMLTFAIRSALRQMWPDLVAKQFDDRHFASLFR